MKRITFPILPFFILLLSSCGNSKTEKAIIDFCQTTGNTKTDLSMEILKLEKLKDIKGIDSFNIVFNNLKEIADGRIKGFEDGSTIKPLNDLIDDYKFKKKYENDQKLIKIYNDAIKESEKGIEAERLSIEKFKNGDYTEDGFKQDFEKANLYKSQSDKILATFYLCNYSIKNPFLNNVKQEFTDTFVLSPMNVVILKKATNP